MQGAAFSWARAWARGAARAWPWLTVALAAVAFRLPELVHAADVNSDVSIVGIQAMHMLRGEWAPMLDGSRYQTSTDAAVAAVYFSIFGPSPLALMMSAFVGHLIVLWIAYSMLSRFLGRARAVILCSLLVFTTCAVDVYALHPPRQTAITLSFLSAWLLSADHKIPSVRLRVLLGGCVAGLSVFADPYEVVFLGPLTVFAAACASLTVSTWRARATLGAIYVAALGAGLIPILILWKSRGGAPPQVVASLAGALPRWNLLKQSCLPIAMGFKIPGPQAPLSVGPTALHFTCGAALMAGIGFAVFALFSRRISRPIRNVSVLALSTFVSTVAAFVLSRCAVDQHSYRYLAACSLMLPFLFAPVAQVVDAKRLTALLLPMVACFAMAGLAFAGVELKGTRITTRGGAIEDDEARVDTYLIDHGVRAAVSSYWEAYTFTFLSREQVIVVPRELWLDRLPSARAQVMNSDKIAYVVDRASPVDASALTDFWLKPFGTPYERVQIGRYTVVLLNRSAILSVAHAAKPGLSGGAPPRVTE